MRSASVSALLTIAGACAPSTGGQHQGSGYPTAAPTLPMGSAPPSMTPGSAPSASAATRDGTSSPTESAPAAPTHTAPEAQTLDWHLVASSDEELSLVPRGNSLAVQSLGGWAPLVGGKLQPTCLGDREAMLPGASPWLVTDFMPMSACPGQPTLWRRQGTAWHFSRQLRVHDLLSAAWTPGRTLIATVPWRMGPPWGYEFTVLEGGAAPRPTPAGPTGPEEDAGPCHTRLQAPHDLLAFPSGEVFIFGIGECPTIEVELVVVERWGARGGKPTFERLPLVYLGKVSAPAPNNLWATGELPGDSRTWFVHFDGLGWTLLPNPLSETVPALAWEEATKDEGMEVEEEALWLLTATRAWRWASPRETGSAAEPKPFSLPSDCETPSQLLQVNHELWLGCRGKIYTTDETVKPIPWTHDDPFACQRQFVRPEERGTNKKSKVGDSRREFEVSCGRPSPHHGPGRPGLEFEY